MKLMTKKMVLIAAVCLLCCDICNCAQDVIIKMPGAGEMRFRQLPAGCFMIGSPDSEQDGDQDEKPLHEVVISNPFHLGVCEVTCAQWKLIMGTLPRDAGDDLTAAVSGVTWQESQTFIQKLNERDLGTFCLPTEAQWEYACRAGTRTRFYWGDDPDFTQANNYAWHKANADGHAQPVGKKKPNAWGLYDMSGNVWEWCSDWYGPYLPGRQVDPKGPKEGKSHVMRGNGWRWGPKYCRSANRFYRAKGHATGLRLVLVQKGPADRPNVLFLFTDDQRNDTVNALGNKFIKTPSIDRLVNSGVAFTNAYIMGGSSPAVCSPSRASLFSGRTLWNLENQGMWGFEISEKYRTLPQVFRENGYVTFATGKNEPGKKGHFNRSFSTGDKILFKGMTRSQYRLPLFSYSPTNDYSNKKSVLHTEKHSAEIYADACIKFLEDQTQSSKPFFAYVAFQTPHDPRQSPAEFRKMYEDENMKVPESFMPNHPFDNGMLKIRDEELAPFPRTEKIVQKHIADYYAMITHTDAQIGRILEALEKTGKLKNTIIVFSGDNGLALGRHGLMGKQNVYDHSVHVPLIISGPGIPAGQVRQQLCYIYDIYPTLCERAGLKTPETVQFKSLNKVIDDAEAHHRDHLYFAFMSWQRSIRDKQYKLIEYCVENSRHTQLFDLLNDPMEIKNLAVDPEYTEKLQGLRTLLKQEAVKLNDGNVPFEFTDKQGKDFWDMYKSVK